MSATTIVDGDEAMIAAIGPKLAQLPLLRAYNNTPQSFTARVQRARAEGDRVRIAKGADGEGIGLCWFLPRGAFATAGYLRLLAVIDGAQSQGAGRALLADFELQCARPPGGYFAWVNATNQTAQDFYRRHGYAPVGPLEGFVRPGETEVLFHRAFAVDSQTDF